MTWTNVLSRMELGASLSQDDISRFGPLVYIGCQHVLSPGEARSSPENSFRPRRCPGDDLLFEVVPPPRLVACRTWSTPGNRGRIMVNSNPSRHGPRREHTNGHRHSWRRQTRCGQTQAREHYCLWLMLCPFGAYNCLNATIVSPIRQPPPLCP